MQMGWGVLKSEAGLADGTGEFLPQERDGGGGVDGRNLQSSWRERREPALTYLGTPHHPYEITQINGSLPCVVQSSLFSRPGSV